jgi:diguanylate cyclase (GGDEF)-like protein
MSSGKNKKIVQGVLVITAVALLMLAVSFGIYRSIQTAAGSGQGGIQNAADAGSGQGSIQSTADAAADKILAASMVQMAVVILVCGGCVCYLLYMGKKLSAEQKRYHLIEKFSDVVLFDYDCEQDIMRFTPNMEEFANCHGTEQKNFVEEIEEKFVYQGDQLVVRQLLSGKFPEEMKEIRLRIMRPSGNRYFWCLMQFQYVYKNNKLKSIIGRLDDIDRKQEEEEHLRQMAQNDQLTGLNNRSTVEEKIRTSMHQEEEGLLFVIDIDNFQKINDAHGHVNGDHALRHIGICVRRAFRTDDIKGRVGGDELVVFVVGTNSREIAERKVQQLEKNLLKKMGDDNINITASTGIARFPSDGTRYEDLFEAADQAMYDAKSSGGGKHIFYEDME